MQATTTTGYREVTSIGSFLVQRGHCLALVLPDPSGLSSLCFWGSLSLERGFVIYICPMVEHSADNLRTLTVITTFTTIIHCKKKLLSDTMSIKQSSSSRFTAGTPSS